MTNEKDTDAAPEDTTENKFNKFKDEVKVKGKDVVNKVKELVKQGNVRRLIVKNPDRKVIMEIPLGLGVLSLVLIPMFTALASLIMIAMDYTIVIERREEEVKKE